MTKALSISLKDHTPEEIQAEFLSALEALRRLKVKGIERVVAAKVNGETRDLSHPIASQAELEPIYMDSEEGLKILRHFPCHGHGR
jgi:hypothetical protein